MYEYLEGTVAQRGPTQLVLDVGGVGFDLAVPLNARFEIAAGAERLKVWTHLVVREDAQLLYAFPTPAVRELFRLLLKVRGVGPSMALGVLSGLTAEELLQAIGAQDPKPLQRVKGVGKKTAEQILLDLRDRAPRLALSIGAEGVISPTPPPVDGAVEDAVQALISIGYSDKEARKSVERATKTVGNEDLEALLRTALRQ
ncbi:MAG: Holliday junction DNA helicase RuvA [Planctomycetota bacterium]|jgi:Holliday junction DNA helicase RuvA